MAHCDEYKTRIDSFKESVHTLSSNLSNESIKKLALLLNEFHSFLDILPDHDLSLQPDNKRDIVMTMLHLLRSMIIQKRIHIDTIMEPALKIMYQILNKTLIKQLMAPEFTKQILIFFGILIYRDENNKQAPCSEEVKHLIVRCISAALPAKYREGRYSSFEASPNFLLATAIRAESFLPAASQSIKGLLDIIEHDQKMELRVDALTVLDQYLIDNIYDIDSIAKLFPGVASKLCTTLIRKPEKEKHQVVVTTLHILGELIRVVMNDEDNENLVEIHTLQDLAIYHGSKKNEATKNTDKVRVKAWYEKNKASLAPLLDVVLKNRSSAEWRTRSAYLEFSYLILSTCSRTLDNCTRSLIRAMVSYRDDPYDQISNKCMIYMQNLSSSASYDSTIMPILKDELYEWMMNFPKYIMVRDEQEKSEIISLITGLVLTLGHEAEGVLSTVLTKCSDGWMTALEIDKDSLHVLEGKFNQKYIDMDDMKQTTPLYPKTRFKHIVSDSVVEKLCKMLNTIGRHCNIQSWVHHYMRYVSTDNLENNEPQSIYIVHLLLQGAIATNHQLENDVENWIDYDDQKLETTDSLKTIVNQVANDIINLLIFSASESTNVETSIIKSGISEHADDSSYVLTICFGLQMIGLATSVIDIEDLQDFLITALYPLLAHLGSSNLYIHTYALITLNIIAIACGLSDAKELAIANIDYVINSVSHHIAVLSSQSRVPLVLKALIHVSGSDCIKYLDDIVEEICDALDRHHHDQKLCLGLCGVLLEIVQTVEKDFLPDKERNASPKSEDTEVYEQPMKCSHFLTAPSAQLRSQILQLLSSGVSVLTNQPKTLNMQSHEIWPYVMNRFGDKENYVVYHAAIFIEKISAVSTDFLSRKFAESIWPQFKALLRKGSDASVANAASKNYSIYSTYHRTQSCVLRSLANILKYVPVKQPLAKEILEETKFYYSYSNIHSQLKDLCMALFDSLSRQQPDSVWLYQLLLDSQLQHRLSCPPSALLKPF
ncbi:TEL2-interacting protein 1, partial [Rhizopus azygosporus]